MTDTERQELRGAKRLAAWLDDFDRDNADDHDNDAFEVGQDELIEVPAEDLRAALAERDALSEQVERLTRERDVAYESQRREAQYRAVAEEQAEAAESRAEALTRENEGLRAIGKTLLAALAVNGWPVSDEHWRNASGSMSIQARALHLAATDFKAALSLPQRPMNPRRGRCSMVGKKPRAGPWSRTFSRFLAAGHDHGSAAYAADQAEKRAATQCPSTHCNRSQECRSPRDCDARTRADFEPEDPALPQQGGA